MWSHCKHHARMDCSWNIFPFLYNSAPGYFASFFSLISLHSSHLVFLSFPRSTTITVYNPPSSLWKYRGTKSQGRPSNRNNRCNDGIKPAILVREEFSSEHHTSADIRITTFHAKYDNVSKPEESVNVWLKIARREDVSQQGREK